MWKEAVADFCWPCHLWRKETLVLRETGRSVKDLGFVFFSVMKSILTNKNYCILCFLKDFYTISKNHKIKKGSVDEYLRILSRISAPSAMKVAYHLVLLCSVCSLLKDHWR